MSFALADELNHEYRAIVDAGSIVQINDAFMATHYDVIGDFDTYRAWAELRVEALNRALEGVPEERSRYHLCWGSWNGPHTNDIEMKRIADLLLRINVGGYAIELNPGPAIQGPSARGSHRARSGRTIRSSVSPTEAAR